MPETQEDALAVGDVYAQALLEAANERQQTDEVAEQFEDLVRYLDGDADFERFLTSLAVDAERRGRVLDTLFQGRMNDLLLNALHVLNRRRRLDILRAVHTRFRLRLEEQRNQIEADVRSAVPLPGDLREELRQMLGRRIGREVILNERVDPSLIGGLVVQVGDRRLDMSLKQDLQRMHAQVLARGSREIHERREYFVEQ